MFNNSRVAGICFYGSLGLCLTKEHYIDSKNFDKRAKSITTWFCLRNAAKASEMMLYTMINWLSSCLLKLTLEGFWDTHSNSDSFHVQKKPIKASVNREIKLSTILAAEKKKDQKRSLLCKHTIKMQFFLHIFLWCQEALQGQLLTSNSFSIYISSLTFSRRISWFCRTNII